MTDNRRIFVVDDDEAVRESLVALIEAADLARDVQGFAAGHAFLDQLQEHDSGCALLDVRLPDCSGLDLQASLNERHSPLSVVMITGHGDVPMAVQALKAGAYDFVEKPFTDEDLLETIAGALAASDLAHRNKMGRQEACARLERLTARESEVLELLVEGHPNKIIAYKLDISVRTVEVHRSRVMEKLESRSLSELVRLSMAAKGAIA